MKILVMFVIFHIAKGDFVDTRENLLLRKLQNFQQQESNPITVTILTSVFVTNVIKPERDAENDNSIWIKYLSQIVTLYKVHVYDKIKKINGETTDSPTNFDLNNSTSDPKDSRYEKLNDSKTNVDPKTEVEVFQPDDGKMQETLTEVHKIAEVSKRDTKDTECPQGSVKNDQGQCTNPKSLKYIINVPPQCLPGYVPDKLGFCRKIYLNNKL